MRLVLVEWLDSYGCSSSWQGVEEPLRPPRVMTCRSVGWLAHDGAECKVLIPHLAVVGDDEPKQGCGDMTIPTVAVVRIEELVSARHGAEAEPERTKITEAKPALMGIAGYGRRD